MKFIETDLDEKIIKAINELGYEEMTSIQEKTYKHITNFEDVVAMSNTGTGKTAAFLLPLINEIDVNNPKTQVLVITPTRELAMQIVSDTRKYTKYLHSINSMAIYGGQEIKMQSIMLRKGAKIVCGTPGRILDLLKKKNLKLSNLSTIVLDEADEMFSMGFEKEINNILEYVDSSTQKLLFSATIDENVKHIANNRFSSPVFIECKENNTLLNNNIRQIAIECKEQMKAEAALRIIKREKARNSIVFCNTKKKTEEIYKYLKNNNINLALLTSDIRQDEREKIFKKFRRGEFDTIVVTDVLARGIDVEDLELVINIDIPIEKEYYIHRIGRTARKGKSGVAYTFYIGKQLDKIKEIEQYTKTKFEYGNVPTLEIQNGAKEAIDYSKNEEGYYIVKLSVGINDSIKAKDIVGAMKAMCGISSEKLGKIIVNEEYSIVEIPEEYIVDVDRRFKKCKIKGIDANIIK